MYNIVIIEDHLMVQQGFKKIIESTNTYTVSQCFSTFSEMAQDNLPELADIYLVDLSLPDKNGFDVIEFIRNKHPQAKILVVSMYEQSNYILTALELNVNGYLSKRAVADDILIALEHILNDEQYLSDEITNALKFNGSKIHSIFDSLTPREVEIFKLLSYGYPPKKLAAITNTSPKTVFTHRSNIYKKMNVNNQFDLLKIALKYELIYLEDYLSN